MTYAILDVESTIAHKGSPYASHNRLCLVGLRINGVNHIFDIEYSGHGYGESLNAIRSLLNNCSTIVGFNLKFDLAWLGRYGIHLNPDHRVFDCQLVEFILSNQSTIYPSLDGCLAKYNLGSKLHTVEEEYWNLGIDTPDVPLDLLTEYLNIDLEKTDELYRTLRELVPPSKRQLVSLQNLDLRCLQEMESNGILFDWQGLEWAANELKPRIEEVRAFIGSYFDYWPWFNYASPEHVSALLYGGTISVNVAEPVEGIYKSGTKKGQQYTRNRWRTELHEFKRLVNPLKGTEMAKEGYWSTDKKVLLKLPKPKKLIRALIELADLEHLRDTYFEGLAKLRDKMDWSDGLVHGQLNQVVARTGRLSASNPNQQNFDSRIQKFIISRYGC